MKKTLALVLALAMVFSTITVAFAEGTIGADAQICADLGMLKGSTGTVDAAYVATAPTRIQAAVMFLRLKGLEADAMAFTGTANFADADKAAWAKPIMAYLKANPQLGWQGDGTNFDPTGLTTAQAYYKVMLETLGYKQTTAEVVGDFAYADVVTFAAGKGLTKVAAVTNYTVNDLATATVEALKANMKDGGKTLVATLVEAGKVDNAKAVAAGLVVAAPVAVTVAVDEVTAIGNTEVQVVFEEDVDAAVAGEASNYAIEGLEISEVVVAGSDTVRLATAAMSAGKLYTMTVGSETVKFAGVAKISGGPEVVDATSNDVEEVVVEFDRELDYATATDVANYTINGVAVVEAAVDGVEVTLTTEGLKNKTDYVVKVTNMKSVDGTSRKSDSESFKSAFDTLAPKMNDAHADTNQRVLVTFNEKVDQATAEDLANYSIKVNETDGAELAIVSIEWDTDDEDNVEIVTEAMDKHEDYKITVNNIADQRKVPNVIAKGTSKVFEGKAEDTKAPELISVNPIVVLSPTMFTVEFKDDSRLDADSVLDPSNYTLECEDTDLAIESIVEKKNATGGYRALFTVEEMESDGDCELTFVDILDEFGNATKETKKTFDASVSEFGSAEMTGVTVLGENTIRLQFSKRLDKTSAQNIANYSITDVGTPTKAVYQKEAADGSYVANSVTLTVNDMVASNVSDQYTITVDGVMDLAGNSLKFEYDFGTAGATWDKEVKLQDADVVNKYIVALTFDEGVTFETGAKVLIAHDAATEATPIELDAKALTEDDTVVEFSNYSTTPLSTTVEYYVYKVVYNGNQEGGIKDLIGNPLTIPYKEFKFYGSADLEEPAEMESYTQVDAQTFKVIMSRDVKVRGGATYPTNFNAVVSTSDATIVYLTTRAGSATIADGTDYNFNLASILEDFHGIPATNDDNTNHVTTFTGEDTDDIAPYIDDVVALDRNFVEITFSERIKTAAQSNFELWNVDLNKKVSVTIGDNTDNDEVITLTTNDLEGRYEYELRMTGNVVADFAGLKAAADTFTFDGSDLAQH